MRATAKRWAALAGLVLAVTACHAPPPPAATLRPDAAAEFERTVAELVDPDGRGLGSPGLDRARDRLVHRFVQLGLDPAFDTGYVQRLVVPQIDRERRVIVENVAAMLPGRGELAREVVIISAHYDHLASVDGVVYPGADDNASGVAVMLLAAEAMAGTGAEGSRRTVAFVAFSGEEEGLLGSRGLVGQSADLRFALPQVVAVVNLDMVGRLAGGPLQVLGVGSSDAWPGLARSAARSAGVAIRLVEDAPPRSDQQPFVARDIPAVLVHTGLHADYHRPTDTPEKLDAPGAVRVTAFVVRLVQQLAAAPAAKAGL